ncbi:MAG: tetratricopeptide repeat protein [Nannocystaceae bacterium]|nr:tetratricopeptide repeat protein [Nannocystaceae bacterium]
MSVHSFATRAALVLFNAGAVREGCGDVTAAQALYRRVIAGGPLADLAHNQLGVIALERGHQAQAVAHFRDAVAANHVTKAARNNLATTLRDRYASTPDDAVFRAAELQAQSVLGLDSDNRRAFENLARIYYDRGRHGDKAYLLLSDLVVSQGLAVIERTGEGMADLLVIRGLILVERDDVARALRAFNQAVAADADHGDAHMNLALIALRQRNFEHARDSLTVAASSPRHASNIETYLGLGVAYRGLRDFSRAQEAFERAQGLDGKDPRPAYNLGILYSEHVGPAAAAFDRRLSAQALQYFKVFVHKASPYPRYARHVRDANFRIRMIDELLVAVTQGEAIAREVAALEERAHEQREHERTRLLEIEARAQAAVQP